MADALPVVLCTTPWGAALGPEDLVVAGILAVAVFTDLRSRRIPNVLTFGGMAVALLVRGVQGEIVWAILGLGLAFAVGFALFWVGGTMRAGDAKLLMALGAVYGPGEIGRIILFTFAINIPVALVLLLVRGRLGSFFKVIRAGVTRDEKGPKPIHAAFAAVIAAGVIAARLLPGVLHFG